MKLFILQLFISLALCQAIKAQNLVNNGSIVGVPGENVVPAGWVNTGGTPDINNGGGVLYTSPGYSWSGGTPTASPDGGTFINLFTYEAISQTITGLTVGQTYIFSYYYSSMGITNYTSVLNPNVEIIGATGYGNPSNTGALFGWSQYTGTLTATSTSINIKALGPYPNYGYTGYDGFSLIPTPQCNAGTTAPTLTSSTNFADNIYTIPCGSTTANLSAITASNMPAGTSLTWHSGTPATIANKISPVTALGTGFHYAAFFDAVFNCYSPTRRITVRTSLCANNPTTQNNSPSQSVTASAYSLLTPTGGSGTYTYSAGAGCTGTGTLITTTVASDGTITYTAPAAAGNYYYCVRVCDNATTQQCVTKTVPIVVAVCNAGTTPPPVN